MVVKNQVFLITCTQMTLFYPHEYKSNKKVFPPLNLESQLEATLISGILRF